MVDTVLLDSSRHTCRLACDTPPVVEVPAGSTLRIHCRNALDCRVGAAHPRADSANPGTGPIAVAEARPGMALRIEILEIEPESPGFVSAGPEGAEQAVELRDGWATFHGVAVRLAPMIGMIGVAPSAGSWSTMEAGCFGGNMDITDIAPGAVLVMPVFQPGGRLIVGDVHAVMGDGEIGGQGLEVAATVTLRLSVQSDPVSDHILIFRDQHIMAVGAGATIEQAVRDSVAAMTKIVAAANRLDEFQATKLLGLIGHVRIGQQCCPIKTVRVAVGLEHAHAAQDGFTQWPDGVE